ncbi:S8 family serine peptidase [Silicimonas algicola]|uniref:Subtilase family protein n=1 Tax=Silicimonas algicola TaxID=1826607 RepID=A0A316G146_9RHOB|nr:S8 family serine peptidase [Silicimonas algicola]PWK54641.1 subtilase family protein [Silicimonas algicola]
MSLRIALAWLATAVTCYAQDLPTRDLPQFNRDRLFEGIEPVTPAIRDVLRPGVPSIGLDRIRRLDAENLLLRDRAALLAAPDALRQIEAFRRAPTRQSDEGVVSVIEFGRRFDADEKARLAEAGVTLEGFVGGSTYVVRFAGDATLPVLASGQIRAGATLRIEDKIGRSLVLAPALAPDAVGRRRVLLSAATGGRDAVQRSLEALGATAIEEPTRGTFIFEVPDNRLIDVAGLADVLSIDAGPPPFLPLTSVARQVANVDGAQGFTLESDLAVLEGVAGRSVRVGIFDTPINAENGDFMALEGDQERFFRRVGLATSCGGEPDGVLAQRHGTLVSGILLGSGRNSVVNSTLEGVDGTPFGMRGIAPEADIGVFEYTDEGEGSRRLALLTSALVDCGVAVSNHSYIETLYGYEGASRLIDEMIAGRARVSDGETEGEVIPPRPQVWAAGNNGLRPKDGRRAAYVSVFTQAKNSISVGAYDTAHQTVWPHSSLGPTFDGRIKPDIVAPGCHDFEVSTSQGGILGPSPNAEGYVRDCGSSMAAPVVTGAIALMREAAGDVEPLPSTYKAALVATAQDLVAERGRPDLAAMLDPEDLDDLKNIDIREPTFYGPGPDFASGFGLIDVSTAVRVMTDLAGIEEGAFDVEGATSDMCFDVSEGAERLKVALAWDDAPANAPADLVLALLVNDLDLTLIAPDGATHLPWKLTPPPLTGSDQLAELARNEFDVEDIHMAERGRDVLNNVELAEVEAPTPGLWRARVTASTLGDGPQTFSVAGDIVKRPCPDPE